MIINEEILKEATGLHTDKPFIANQAALVNTELPGSITFIDDNKFIAAANANRNITIIITEQEFTEKISKEKQIIVSEDARHCFFSLLNFIAKKGYHEVNSDIHFSVQIHERAFVSGHNVSIGEGTIIEPNVTILPDVMVGTNCIIRAGAVLGSEGFEHKRTKKGVLPVIHNGKVIIGDHVEIGANCTVDKGFSFRHTSIQEYTKLDNLVHIAHGVHIGKACFIAASAMLAGSVTLKDNVWIGPGANIASGITIGNKAQVTIGAVVVQHVEEEQVVSGNFAIDHRKFLKNIIRMQQQ
jgi:UDP-3-O-[3-hydroxymyristoyl] glucosamine N-acyltransferase